MMRERNELLISRWLVLGTVVAHLASGGISAFSSESLSQPESTEGRARPLYIGMSWAGVVPRGQAVNVAIPDSARCLPGFAGAAAVAGKPGSGVVGINQVSGGIAVPRGAVGFAGIVGFPSGAGMWLHHNDVVQFAFPENADLSDVAITLKCERS